MGNKCVEARCLAYEPGELQETTKAIKTYGFANCALLQGPLTIDIDSDDDAVNVKGS